MEQKDEVRRIQLQELQDRMDKGLAQNERGEGADGEVFMQGLLEDLDTRELKRKAGCADTRADRFPTVVGKSEVFSFEEENWPARSLCEDRLTWPIIQASNKLLKKGFRTRHGK